MNKITIVGAGTMGHSLAQVFAQSGYHVALSDVSEELLQKARRFIASNLDTLSEVKLFDPADRKVVAEKRIHYTTDLEAAVDGTDMVIEAIIEDLEAKKKLFTQLDRLSPPEAILASNTSYLDIYQFIHTRRPHKVLITHWFNPPHIVPLVEIVPGPHTSTQTIETVKDVLHKIGKQTVVLKKFLPGFIANRLQGALDLEVYHLIDNGYATPEEIDKAIKASFGLRIPLLGNSKRDDFAGLDLVQKVLRNKAYVPPEVQDRCKFVDELVSKGHLGVKSGKGFYDYKGRSTEDIIKERDIKLLRLKKFLEEIGELE